MPENLPTLRHPAWCHPDRCWVRYEDLDGSGPALIGDHRSRIETVAGREVYIEQGTHDEQPTVVVESLRWSLADAALLHGLIDGFLTGAGAGERQPGTATDGHPSWCAPSRCEVVTRGVAGLHRSAEQRARPADLTGPDVTLWLTQEAAADARTHIVMRVREFDPTSGVTVSTVMSWLPMEISRQVADGFVALLAADGHH